MSIFITVSNTIGNKLTTLLEGGWKLAGAARSGRLSFKYAERADYGYRTDVVGYFLHWNRFRIGVDIQTQGEPVLLAIQCLDCHRAIRADAVVGYP